MYAKTAALLGWFGASYAFLVFVATNPWRALGSHVRWLKWVGRPAVMETRPIVVEAVG
jgi:hypothetical protein